MSGLVLTVTRTKRKTANTTVVSRKAKVIMFPGRKVRTNVEISSMRIAA